MRHTSSSASNGLVRTWSLMTSLWTIRRFGQNRGRSHSTWCYTRRGISWNTFAKRTTDAAEDTVWSRTHRKNKGRGGDYDSQNSRIYDHDCKPAHDYGSAGCAPFRSGPV